MNRRDFFKNMALSAGGVYVSTKTIFLPPAGGWTINSVGYSHVIPFDVPAWQAEILEYVFRNYPAQFLGIERPEINFDTVNDLVIEVCRS